MDQHNIVQLPYLILLLTPSFPSTPSPTLPYSSHHPRSCGFFHLQFHFDPTPDTLLASFALVSRIYAHHFLFWLNCTCRCESWCWFSIYSNTELDYKFHHSPSKCMLSLPCCLLIYTIITVFKPSMDFRLLPILGFLSLSVVTNATLTSEDYWQSILPNTEVPKAIRDLLPYGSGGTEEKSPLVVVQAGKSPASNYYWQAASKYQLRDDPNVALFFLEKDLHPGTTMNLQFIKTTTEATFLPREEAKAIPFSSNKFSLILQRFSVMPRSKEAQVMKKTIQECEEPAVQGEDKYCATSLESMVDFSTSKLGTNVQVVSTEVDKEDTQKQKYTITTSVKKMMSNKSVVCHDQPYVYVVFYCHATRSTRTYKVALVGADGTKANAVAVCHMDTAKWNPKHVAFQVLNVKPGTTPVCHFLQEGQVVWVHN